MVDALRDFQIGRKRTVVQQGSNLREAAANLRHKIFADIDICGLVAFVDGGLTNQFVEGESVTGFENEAI